MSVVSPAQSPPLVRPLLVQSDYQAVLDDGEVSLLDADNSLQLHQTSPLSASSTPATQEHITPLPGRCKTKTPKGRYVRCSFLRSWFYEIGAVLISVLSFLAAVVIMSWTDDGLLSNWTFHYSINTVISILTNVSRTTLAFAISACLSQQKWNIVTNRPQRLTTFKHFDSASRGPLGGLELLSSLKLRHFGALGAYATVSFLVFDPLLQGMISYPGRLGDSTSSSGSSIDRVLRLDIGTVAFRSETWRRQLPGSHRWIVQHQWADNKADLGLSMATMQGFANISQSKPTVSATCESGYCTWPQYNSLDVCSACTDVTSHIARKRRLILRNYNLSWKQELIDGNNPTSDCINVATYPDSCFILSPDNVTVTDGQHHYDTNPYNLPVQYNLNYQLASVGYTNLETAFLNASEDQVMIVNATSDPQETINFQNITTLLAAFTVLKAPDSYLQNKSTWNETIPSADECALYFCINQYNVGMINGTVQQVVKPSQFWRNPNSFGNSTSAAFVNQSTNLIGGFMPTRLYNVSMAMDAVRSWFSTSALWNSQGTIFQETLQQIDLQLVAESQNGTQEAFNVSANTVFSTIQYMLSWTVGHNINSSSLPNGFSNNFVWRTANATGNSFIDMLYQSTNISVTFENAARQMSSYIQNINAPEKVQKDTFAGASQAWATHIKIQWSYITLPAVTLFAGYVYVILAMCQTWRLGARPWKDSTIPLLSHGLKEAEQQVLRNAESDGSFDAVEKMAWLRFEGGTTGGLKLGSSAGV